MRDGGYEAATGNLRVFLLRFWRAPDRTTAMFEALRAPVWRHLLYQSGQFFRYTSERRQSLSVPGFVFQGMGGP